MGGGSQDLGAPVSATHTGKVLAVHSYTEGNGAGNSVHVISPDGKFKTVYMHLNTVDVKNGQAMSEGQQLGTVGGSGKGSMNGQDVHLHYELHKAGKGGALRPVEPAPNGQMIDPQQWIQGANKPESAATAPAGPPVPAAPAANPDPTTSPINPVNKTYGYPENSTQAFISLTQRTVFGQR